MPDSFRVVVFVAVGLEFPPVHMPDAGECIKEGRCPIVRANGVELRAVTSRNDGTLVQPAARSKLLHHFCETGIPECKLLSQLDGRSLMVQPNGYD